jgi:hypothetical protein
MVCLGRVRQKEEGGESTSSSRRNYMDHTLGIRAKDGTPVHGEEASILLQTVSPMASIRSTGGAEFV